MSNFVIRTEGLGKKYLIGHESQSERYTTLRDVAARTAKGFARSAVDMVRGRQLVVGDDIEEFWALKDVSFEIKRGEVVGIIGRNGAGKSTLLKILSRITEPSAGRAEIKGRVASLLEVGTGFHPELTGRENTYLNGAILGMTRAEVRRKFDEIVAFAEVEKFLDTPVKRYSSGMYVRLAFAVAAHLEPDILVVDEVLAVGDAEFQRKCLGKIRDVADCGRTVLFVSHNIEAVERLCNICLMLEKGKLAKLGPVSEVVSQYLESRPSSDLSKYRDTRYKKTSELVSIEVRGNPLRVFLRVRPTSPEPRDFALVFHDSKQNPLFTTHLTDQGDPVEAAEEVELSVAIPVTHLRPGWCFVSFVSFSPNRASYFDIVLHVPVQIHSTSTPSFITADRWGAMYFGTLWSVNK